MSDFDFKKAQKELIRKELRPLLYENGFVLSRPTTYIREREGLLQEFYFRVEVGKLRTWASYRPVFDSRWIVSFGTDSICVSDCKNPYKGFGWCFFEYLESCIGHIDTDEEADKMFYEYCNKIRMANKLSVK